MNRYYFKHKDNPARVCYEVYGIDRLTGIRYSVALCGTRKAAQKALGSEKARKMMNCCILCPLTGTGEFFTLHIEQMCYTIESYQIPPAELE